MARTIYLACVATLLAVGVLNTGATSRVTHSSDIPTVEHCALIANPTLYDGKEIRVRGVYSVCGKNDSKFFSSSCGDGKTIWVEFDPTYQSCSKSKAVKSLAEMTRKSGTRWGPPHTNMLVLDYRDAEVEFVGKFNASNPYKQPEAPPTAELPFRLIRPNRERYDFLFQVSCVERVKPLPKNANY